jgi:hypothetical protein
MRWSRALRAHRLPGARHPNNERKQLFQPLLDCRLLTSAFQAALFKCNDYLPHASRDKPQPGEDVLR